MNQSTNGKNAFGIARFRYTICSLMYILTRPAKAIQILVIFKSASLLTISSGYPGLKPALKIIKERKLEDPAC
jgi:hypothetical protein